MRRTSFWPPEPLEIIFLTILVVIILCTLFTGCCTVKPEGSEVRRDTLLVHLPGRVDTLRVWTQSPAGWTVHDSIYVVEVDTVIRQVTVHAKPREIRVPYYDTVAQFPTKVIKPSLLEYAGIAALGAFGASLIFVGLLFYLSKFLGWRK